jgi:hypothetical protein
LAKHLGGRSQPVGDDFQGSSLKVETGGELVPELASRRGLPALRWPRHRTRWLQHTTSDIRCLIFIAKYLGGDI